MFFFTSITCSTVSFAETAPKDIAEYIAEYEVELLFNGFRDPGSQIAFKKVDKEEIVLSYKGEIDAELSIGAKMIAKYTLEDGLIIVDTNSGYVIKVMRLEDMRPGTVESIVEKCLEKGKYTTAAMYSCLDLSYFLWDLELNRVYKYLGGSSNKALKDAQHAWLKYRDKMTDFIDGFYSQEGRSGSLYPIFVNSRKIQLVQEQVKLLQSIE